MHKNLQLSVIAAVAVGVFLLASTFASAAFAGDQINSISIKQKIKQEIEVSHCGHCGNHNDQTALNNAEVSAIQTNVK